jgi:hypothetical protein
MPPVSCLENPQLFQQVVHNIMITIHSSSKQLLLTEKVVFFYIFICLFSFFHFVVFFVGLFRQEISGTLLTK